jgi:hypothetical protein
MSTDITPLEDGKLPSYIQKLELDDTTNALAGESGYKRIAIKGSVFRMMEGSQELASSDDRSMKVVIVNASPFDGRTYYGGTYQAGESRAPDCFSADGTKPHESVESPQSLSCATCPKNEPESGPNGKGKACRYSRKIAVVLGDNLEGDVYAMQIPATSLFGAPEGKWMPLKAYGKFLKAMNVPISAVVTEMKFDKNSPVPKLLFKAVGALKEEQFALMQRQGKTQAAINAIGVKGVDSNSQPVKVEKKKVEEKTQKLNDVLDEFDD